MNFGSVKEILETDYESIANKKLKNGWTLLRVDTITVGESKQLIYVLGWTREQSEEEYVYMLNNQSF